LTIVEVSRPLGDAATLKIGGWSHFGRFDRPGTAAGETLSPDWAVYALVDARIAGAADAARQLRVFARATWSPPDRNPVTGYADAGIELTAPIARRPRDAAGLAFATAWLSNRLPAANGPRAEHVLELSYRAAFGRYVTVQPNLQVVFDPVDPTTLIGRRETALIAGARFAAMF
jgi:porin